MIRHEKRNRYLYLLFTHFAIFLLCFNVSVAQVRGAGGESSQEAAHGTPAGEGAADSGEHKADRSADLRDLSYRFLNFTLMLVIIVWAVKKAGAKKIFSERSEDIRRSLEDLKKSRQEYEGSYKELEERLKAFEGERAGIIEQYKREGVEEKEKIIHEAEQRVAQIIAQAESTIQQEMQSARERLKWELVDLAAQGAQGIISKKITDEDQDHLVDEFIEKMGKIH